MTFYELKGEFGKYVGTRFNALVVACRPKTGGDDLYWIEDDALLLVVKSVDIAVKILMLCGENFHTLTLYNGDGNLSFDSEMIKSIAGGYSGRMWEKL